MSFSSPVSSPNKHRPTTGVVDLRKSVRGLSRAQWRAELVRLAACVLVVGCWLASTGGCVSGTSRRWPAVVGREVSFASFRDDQGRSVAESSDRPRPWLLVPFYARCPRTCSPLVENVRRATEPLRERGLQFRVIALSFDPEETETRLREFRARLKLPDDWLLVRATDRAALRDFLSSIQLLPVPQADGEFDHPNVVYVLSPDRRVVDVEPGLVPSTEGLAVALARAQRGPRPSNPVVTIGAFAVGGFLLTIALATFFRRFGSVTNRNRSRVS